MYAIIETGSKQYRAEKNAVLSVEKLDAEKGASITFDRVLLASNGEAISVGTPVLKGASVVAKVLEQYQGDKVISFKKRRRHGYQRTRGHRQKLTKVQITDIKIS